MEQDKPKTLMLKFSGNKQELHTQFKTWCAASKKTMSGTVIELIQELIEAEKEKTN